MDDLDVIFSSLADHQSGQEPTIACLYTGRAAPKACAPMRRVPAPQIGQVLDMSFTSHVIAALALNPAIHDGAIMLSRLNVSTPFIISGWSYRLFPPHVAKNGPPNRGSAFNSCLAMSKMDSVERMYLLTRGVVTRFISGSAEPL